VTETRASAASDEENTRENEGVLARCISIGWPIRTGPPINVCEVALLKASQTEDFRLSRLSRATYEGHAGVKRVTPSTSAFHNPQKHWGKSGAEGIRTPDPLDAKGHFTSVPVVSYFTVSASFPHTAWVQPFRVGSCHLLMAGVEVSVRGQMRVNCGGPVRRCARRLVPEPVLQPGPCRTVTSAPIRSRTCPGNGIDGPGSSPATGLRYTHNA
jgi:hypothetical protein